MIGSKGHVMKDFYCTEAPVPHSEKSCIVCLVLDYYTYELLFQ